MWHHLNICVCVSVCVLLVGHPDEDLPHPLLQRVQSLWRTQTLWSSCYRARFYPQFQFKAELYSINKQRSVQSVGTLCFCCFLWHIRNKQVQGWTQLISRTSPAHRLRVKTRDRPAWWQFYCYLWTEQWVSCTELSNISSRSPWAARRSWSASLGARALMSERYLTGTKRHLLNTKICPQPTSVCRSAWAGNTMQQVQQKNWKQTEQITGYEPKPTDLDIC